MVENQEIETIFFMILYKLLTEMAYFDLGMDVERYREIFSQSNQQIWPDASKYRCSNIF